MISDDKLYGVLADLIADRKKSCTDAFTLFIKLYSAVVGGAVALAIATQTPRPSTFAIVSDILIGIIGVVAIILLWEAKRGWWKLREAQSRIVKENAPNKSYHVPPPVKWPTLLGEIAMGVCILAAVILYWWFNPLR